MKIILIPPNKKHDYLAETIIEGLKKHKVEIISSDIGNGTEVKYSDDEIIEHSQDADFIFVIWGKVRNNNPPKYYLLDKINRPEVTVYVDGSEYSYTGYDDGGSWINKEMLDKCNWYFKRECYPEDMESGIIPLPFGIVDRYFYSNEENKFVHLLAAFGQTKTGLRKNIVQFLNQYKQDKDWYIITSPVSNYSKYLKSSYMCVDSYGGGECNARPFEVLANKVCLILEKYKIVIPHPFTDGNNIIEFSNIIELEEKLNYYLKNLEEVVEIGKRGYDHAMKFHTSIKRLDYIFNKIKN